MLLSPRKNGLDSLFKEVWAFKEPPCRSDFFFGYGVFAYSWKLPAYSGAFLLTVDNFGFLLTILVFLLTMGKCA